MFLSITITNGVVCLQSYGQKLEPRVAAAVVEELNGLSSAPPKLPWTSSRK
jgi:hypothetical protein